MAEAWEYYVKQPPSPVYSKPLCPHQLIRERTKVAHDLLALSLVDCEEAMNRDTWKSLQSALVAVQRLRGVLGRKPRCECRPTQSFEEEPGDDETPDDSDD